MVCPFRGEEKQWSSTDDPRAELQNKLVWTYGHAPYVLGESIINTLHVFRYVRNLDRAVAGYYAIGPDVTFVALCPPRSIQLARTSSI